MPREGTNGSVDWRLLGRYLAGECSDEEAAALQAWFATDVEGARQLLEARKVWEVVGDEKELPERVGSAWERFEAWRRRRERTGPVCRAGTGRQPPGAASVSSRRSGREPRRPMTHARSHRSPLLRAGALVALLALAGLLAMLLTDGTGLWGEPAQAKMFTTKRGQQATIRLTDGTRVRLNAESKLVLAAGFSDDRRRVVWLEGEAYFEVARDTTRPFVVHAQGATIAVLGTRFDVKAYPGEKTMHVAVTEGRVAVQADPAAVRDTSVVLRPSNLAVVAGSELVAVHERVNLSRYLAWTEGRLVFKDAPFDEVARTLERWYDLDVEVRAAPEALGLLNATFDDESLREVLAATAAALGLQYEKVGRSVTFFRPDHRSASYRPTIAR